MNMNLYSVPMLIESTKQAYMKPPYILHLNIMLNRENWNEQNIYNRIVHHMHIAQ